MRRALRVAPAATLLVAAAACTETVTQTRDVLRVDTVVVVDTVLRVDTLSRVDTLLRLDTILQVDTLLRLDTLLQVDTLLQIDTVLRVDTLLQADTVVQVDTVLQVDTLLRVDTLVQVDTLTQVDTVVRIDTVPPLRPVYRPVPVASGLGGASGHLTALTADAGGILVAEQRGRIERLDGTLVHDLAEWLPRPATAFGGLFNLVHHQGRLFAFYSTNDSLAVVAEVLPDGTPRPLIVSDRYRVQHYGGGLDAEGDFLYAAFGDGQHFQGEGETTGLFGRLVRLHLPTLAVDTLARGLRSPWRIDVHHDSVWIADTGAFLHEEINRVAVTERSLHLGWPHMEGRHCHVTDCSGLVGPLLTYPTAAFGCSAVIGGVVWQGRYWFSDHCEAWFRSATDTGVRHEFDLPGQVIAFGEVGGRLYVLGYQEGRVWEVVEVR